MPGYNLEFKWTNKYSLSFNIHDVFYKSVIDPELTKLNQNSYTTDGFIVGPVVRLIWEQSKNQGYTIGSTDFGFPISCYLWELGETNTFFV